MFLAGHARHEISTEPSFVLAFFLLLSILYFLLVVRMLYFDHTTHAG